MSYPVRSKSKKSPGSDVCFPLAVREKHIKDLCKLTHIELVEIKEREEKLLANKSKFACLPDKGKRIQDFYNKVVEELERRTNIEATAALLSQLNIAARGERLLNNMEWNGKFDENADPTDDILDSDDEAEINPLRILAQATMHERRIKILPPEPQLITAEDLKEIDAFATESLDSGLASETVSEKANSVNEIEDTTVAAEMIALNLNKKLPILKEKLQDIVAKSPENHRNTSAASTGSPSANLEEHVLYLVKMSEQQPTSPQREKFKPYQTTISNVHDPAKERQRKQGKHWEVTAATPPPIQHSAAKMLTLLDSVEIQTNYLANLKRLQEKQATERLAAKLKRMEHLKMTLPEAEILATKKTFTVYRSPVQQIEGEHNDSEFNEVYDPLDEEKSGGSVNYTCSD